MERCEECGCTRMVPSAQKITLGPHGESYDKPMPAVRCADCGRMYPAAAAIESSRRITLPPPPSDA